MTYERVAKLEKCRYTDSGVLDIREIEIGGDERMIAHWRAPCLTLLDLGKKALISSAKCNQVKKVD